MQGEEIMKKENKKHSDAKEDKKLVKKMVKKGCMKWFVVKGFIKYNKRVTYVAKR